ncbi:MAG: WYL domain-containing protein [Verrucomicrobiales bacterium]
MREAGADVCRLVFQAVLGRNRLRVRYWSLNSGRASWREIAPHAFAHDGYRWHVRAWCYNNSDYRDFVLSRVEACDSMMEIDESEALPIDAEWERWECVELRPDSRLSEIRQAAIRRDYGMSKRGVLKVTVRSAMKPYLLSHLFIPQSTVAGTGNADNTSGLPRHLEIVEPQAD